MNAEKGSAVMPRLLGIGAIAVVALVSGTAFGGAENVEPAGFQGHGSSLRATVTLADGGARIVTLQGTGCTNAICSRVRALDTNAESIWLDDLMSVHDVSPEGDGVSALFSFKDGSQRRSSIRAGNRILYIAKRFGRTERLDLARVTRIQFE